MTNSGCRWLFSYQRRAQPAANGYGEVPAERAIVAEAAFQTAVSLPVRTDTSC